MHFLINHHLSWSSRCFDLYMFSQIHSTFVMTQLLIEGFFIRMFKIFAVLSAIALVLCHITILPVHKSLSVVGGPNTRTHTHTQRLRVTVYGIKIASCDIDMTIPALQSSTVYERSLQKRVGNVGIGKVMWENICTRWFISSSVAVTLKS